MKKLKEINLTPSSGRGDAPHVKGKQPYYSGYSGGMTDSAASSYSSWMSSKKFDITLEEEEDSEEEIDLMPENILKARIRKATGGYSLNETLKIINESNSDGMSSEEEKEYIHRMSKIHYAIITDIIDFCQRFVEAVPVAGPFDEITSFAGGQIAQFTLGNAIGAAGLGKYKFENAEGMAKVLADLYKPIQAFQDKLVSFLTLGQAQPLIDSFNMLGELGDVINKSEVKKSSVYKPSIFDMAKDFLGDAFHSVTSAADPTNITGIAKGGALAWWNLETLDDSIEEGRVLLDEYYSKKPFYSKENLDNSDQSFNPNQEIDAMLSKAVASSMRESNYYGIDEDLDEDMYADLDEEEIAEFSEHAGGGGPATPLGTGPDGARETNKKRKKREEEANIYKENVRRLQDWKLKTTGRTRR